MEKAEKVSLKVTEIKPELLEVKVAHFQAAVMLPGGFTETSLNAEKMRNMAPFEMRWVKGEGLFVKNKHGDALIPTTNIKCVLFVK